MPLLCVTILCDLCNVNWRLLNTLYHEVPEQLENEGLDYMGIRVLNNIYRIIIVASTDAHISII